MSTRLRSFSKINLGLAVGPARPDGFHALTTLYQTLDAHDLVTVEARPAAKTAISLTSDNPRVPTDSRNTAWKAVELTLAAAQITAEVAVHIEKRLPIQGGMGAGSANAVAALVALERELEKHGQAPISAPGRLTIAAQIGSDVPLFLIGGAILGVGRGEEVYPMPDLPVTHCVVALPEIGVSTPQAFRAWDLLHAEPSGPAPGLSLSAALTRPHPSDRLGELSRAFAAALCEPHSSGVFTLDEGLAGNSESSAHLAAEVTNPLLALVRTGIENDFEEVVFPEYPLLGEIKRVLAASEVSGQAAFYVSLSGSGSALFGLYGTARAAESAVIRLEERGIRSLLTKTLPRSAYWRSMVVK
jgi:4-diphosphocytidyl-2-C-methyl-D-erythritol kinase